MAQQAQEGDRVKVHYTGTLEDGTEFDSSVQRDQPLEFTIGEGQVIAGFEDAVRGMEEGETKASRIPADEAYGPRRDDLVVTVERSQIPEDVDLRPGQQLQIRQPDGSSVPVVVAELSDGEVTLDANHPLAGQDLNFQLQLVEIA